MERQNADDSSSWDITKLDITGCNSDFQVAIKIIDKTQLNPTSLQKVRQKVSYFYFLYFCTNILQQFTQKIDKRYTVLGGFLQ